jgi:hypothetical protein
MELYEIQMQAMKDFQEKSAGLRPAFRIKRRRTASDRLKSRLYYRRHKAKIKLWRRRYSQRMKLMHHARKMLAREKPSWLTHKKNVSSKPKSFKSFLHHLTKGNTVHLHKSPSLLPKPEAPSHKGSMFRIHVPKKVPVAKPL